MTCRALLPLLVLAAVATASASASADGTHVMRLAPLQDVSLPFWCDWGYDWDERCYRVDGDRLPIGGEDDKVWRAALRFSTASLPPGSSVLRATLVVFHDGRCLGPRKTVRACEPRTYELSAHPIASSDWFKERELEFGPATADAEIGSADRPQQLSFDLTGLVAGWMNGTQSDAGVLLKLADWYEDLSVSGPSVPSSTFAQSAARPRLEIAYLTSSS